MSSGCAPAIARRFRIQGESGSMQQQSEPSWKERMAIALARDIIDGERIISGAHTERAVAPARRAQKMHAPNIKLQLGGTGFLVNVSALTARLPKTSTD